MTTKKKRAEQARDDPSNAIDARTLPHNLEAERSVLGAILVHNAAYEHVSTMLRPEDFYRDAHQRIYRAIVHVFDELKIAADFVTVKEELARVGDLDEAGGPAYVSSLVDGVPRATNIEYYGRIVKEKSALRALIFAANRMLTDAYAAEDPIETILSKADAELLNVQRSTLSSRLVDLRADSMALYADLEYRVEHRGQLTGVETGFASINDLTFGWQLGDLIVLAARPSIGKTTFALNSAFAAARLGKRVAFFSLEMRRRQLEYRLLASLSRVALTRIIGGFVGSVDLGHISEAIEIMHTAPIAIDDRSGQGLAHIRGSARRLRAEAGLDLIVIDYVQLMPGELDRRGTTRNEEVTDISRRLKELADELSVPVLLLSQLSRASEKRADPRPKLSDLRESGALEQDADIVAFLHRANHRTGGTTEMIFEKQRNGPTGSVYLTLDRDTTTFTDGGEPEPTTPEQAEQPRRKRYAGRKEDGSARFVYAGDD